MAAIKEYGDLTIFIMKMAEKRMKMMKAIQKIQKSQQDEKDCIEKLKACLTNNGKAEYPVFYGHKQ